MYIPIYPMFWEVEEYSRKVDETMMIDVEDALVKQMITKSNSKVK